MNKQLNHIVLLAAFSGMAVAADGDLGATSTATATVSVTKGDAVKISDVDSFSFDTSATSVPNQKTDDICVYSTTGNYYITASSTDVGNSDFEMESPSSDKIRYTVKWTNDMSSNDGTPLSYNAQSTVFTGADQQNQDCASTNATAKLILNIDQTSWDNAPANNTFTDTLQLVVAPN